MSLLQRIRRDLRRRRLETRMRECRRQLRTAAIDGEIVVAMELRRRRSQIQRELDDLHDG